MLVYVVKLFPFSSNKSNVGAEFDDALSCPWIQVVPLYQNIFPLYFVPFVDNTVSFAFGVASVSSFKLIKVSFLCLKNLTLKILSFTKLSVSAVKSTLIPSTKSIPSTLYPTEPSIVLITSLVLSSIKSTFAFA